MSVSFTKNPVGSKKKKLIQDELYIAVCSDVFVLDFIMVFSSEKAVIRQRFFFTIPHMDRIEIL